MEVKSKHTLDNATLPLIDRLRTVSIRSPISLSANLRNYFGFFTNFTSIIEKS